MAVRKFYAIIEIDDEWEGDKHDMVCWLEAALCPAVDLELEAAVWDNLKEFFEDNVLETLAEG